MTTTSTPRTPLIVNVGMGVDSVAMLVGLQQRGERPDVVIFADVGAEKPETYSYIPVLQAWLARVGFPSLTVVRRPVGPSGDDSLEASCLRLETLPSASFRGKSCSLKWKAEAMDKFLLGVSKGPNKRPGLALVVDAVQAGIKPIKAIGYDAGPKDSKRTGKAEDDVWSYRYPLREWGWSRERCIEEIAAAGLPVPVKSACFFCANSKPWELRWLAAKHPELFARALRVEDTARNGQHGLDKVKGLWGHAAPKGQAGGGSWRAWAEAEGIVAPGGYDVICDRTALMARALAEKPSIESNDDRPCARDDADEAPAQLVQLGRRAPVAAPAPVVEAPVVEAPVAVPAPVVEAPVVEAPVAVPAPVVHLALVGPDRTGHRTLVWGYACGERATVLDAARADAASHDCPHPEALVALEVDADTAREIEDGMLDADDLGLVGDPPGEELPTLALVPAPAPVVEAAPTPARRRGPTPRALLEACRAYYDRTPLDDPDYDPEACVRAVVEELPGADPAQLQVAAQRAFDAALAAEVAA